MRAVTFLSLAATFLLPDIGIAACLHGGDERPINAALQAPGARVLLCPGAVFDIRQSIVMRADGQELATEGSPGEDRFAVIRVDAPGLATAIFSRASNLDIHHLTVDGSRPRLGRIQKGGALIEVGGPVRGVVIDHIRARDPRGWSSLHVFEGARDCAGARVTNNRIGPAGTPDSAWADGISYACRDGFVAGNRVEDASDGGIVIFGAPGSVIEDNVVTTRVNTLLGGINLVDDAPYDGDYTGVIVRNNRIHAQGGFIKVAIAIGPGVWGIPHGGPVHGATVRDNLIDGAGIGYGVAVDNARDIIVTGNRVSGPMGAISATRCDKDEAVDHRAFVRDAGSTLGVYQKDFTLGHVRYALCVNKKNAPVDRAAIE
jgi:hypothetical protein